MDKSKYGMLVVIVALGLFGGVIALSSLTVFIPTLGELEQVTINAKIVRVNQSPTAGFGGGLRWFRQIKISESDAADATYYYFYDLETSNVYIRPGDKIDALVAKYGDAGERRFIWQLSSNSKVILPYEDVVSAEYRRKKSLMVYGLLVIAGSFLLYLMLKYSKE
jgi:hypothetical protein